MGWFGDSLKLGGKALKWAGPAALAPLTGGASLALYGVYGQQDANAKNMQLAREQMNFQERMRNTEVQARVKDLIAAGLNPALAYQQTASSPSGQTAQMENALSGAATTAIQARRAKAEIDNMRATNENISADTDIKRATEANLHLQNLLLQTDTSAQSLDARQRKLWWEAEKVRKEIDNVIENTQITQAQREQVQRLTNHIVKEKQAQAITAELGVTEAEANQQLWETIQGWGKAAGLASGLMNKLRVIIFRRAQ